MRVLKVTQSGTGATAGRRFSVTVGRNGPQGEPGVGVPAGGTSGQVLAKNSATNYDTAWITNTGGGGGSGTASNLDYQGTVVSTPARLDGTRLVLPGTVGNYASTPSTTALQLTGTIEFVSRIAFTDWTRDLNQPIITKRTVDTAIDSYAFALSNGVLICRWRDSTSAFRTTSSTAVPFADGDIGWVKATLVPNNGSGGYTVSFYTATDAGSNTEPSSWTARGVTTTTSNAGTILTNTSPLEFGSERLGTDVSVAQPAETSYVYRSIVRSGIGGTAVCDATFNAAADTLSFTESSTNAATVTITQARRDASSQQVVRGDDSRMEDTRFPRWNRYTFSNADYTIFSNASSLVVQSGTLSAPRTVTLPSTATFTAGQEIILWSGAGVSSTNTLTLDGSGAETINGAATFEITEPNRMFRLVANSTSTPHWVLGTSAQVLHAAQHGTAGADPVSLDASQIATGTIATARLGSGTADAFHFLAGDSTWQDAVPLDVAVKNTSAATIAKGVPVYATGTVGATSVIEIAPADSASSATMSAIGLTTTSLAVNATGYVRVIGVLTGLNTSGYAVNGAAYVASGGGLTPTRPTGATTLVQNIGRATRINASTGEILILGPGRTNDVPNLIATNFLASSGTASSATYLRGDQSWSSLGGAATLNVGTSAGTVAAGDDARLSDERAPKFPRTAWTGAANLDLDGIGGSRFVVQTGTLTTGRDFGLPNGPSDMQTGEEIILQVGAGVSPAKPITVKRNLTDLINGNAANVVITTAYSWVRFIWTSTGWNYDENSVTPYNGGNFVTGTVTNAIAETVPGGAGFGATSGGGTGVAHLHGIYLPRGTTITTITFVSGVNAAVTPTNQWFALCNDARTVLRVTANDTTTAWNASTAKPLNLTSTYTTTYSGLHYLACCVTAGTVPSFRGANVGTFTGVAVQSFTSTTGLTTPVAEGTTFAASTGRLSQALGIVS